MYLHLINQVQRKIVSKNLKKNKINAGKRKKKSQKVLVLM